MYRASIANQRHVFEDLVALLAQALPDLAGAGWQVAPLILVRFGRVAVGDAVARAQRRQRRRLDWRAAGAVGAR
jgi:ethanolamine ammonia-lyase small subunit